ncbi:MAG: CoA activase [Candidatus Hecatellales archaeon]|nr:MAG: CoA activase [Candidatus Hecatellales archaeon]
MITAGVDVGAKYAKIILLENRGKVLGKAKVVVGFDIGKSVSELFEKLLADVGLKRDAVNRVVATGMGRESVHKTTAVNAEEIVPEVVADAKGAYHLVPTVRTVIDVGAEEGRGIRVAENGKVKDFVVNERCAAGAGTFVEAMARALEVRVEDMGPLALKSTKTIPMNAQCTIFAESEVVSLIHSKVAKEDISKAIHDAMAGRIASMALRLGIEKDVVLIGGVALNPGFLPPLEKELNTKIIVPENPDYVGALGAALIAVEGGE